MDSGIPEYSANGFLGSSKGQNDLFHMFHNFLGIFHGGERTGMNDSPETLPGLLGGIFPGLNQQFNDAQSMLPQLGQIFGRGFNFSEQA
jgi:hypothetical protein